MVTNQRSILLQRAMRAEQARKIAEDDATRVREALREAQTAIARLQHAAALSAVLTPVSKPPHDGARVRLVKTLIATYAHGNWQCPHTGALMLPETGMYWHTVETEDEL